MKKAVLFSAVIATAALLAACGGNSNSNDSTADSMQTQTQIQALAQQVSALQGQVAAMQQSAAAAPAVFIRAPNAPAPKAARQGVSIKTTSPSCSGLGTLTGRPSDSDPISSDDISGISCTGYYFTVSGAATSSDNAIVQPLLSTIAVLYDSPNCAGNAYVALGSGFTWNGVAAGVSSGAVANGAVFRVYMNGSNDPTNAASYLMLKGGTALSNPLIQSVLVNSACQPFNSSLGVYELAPNDQTISGVPSAPIPGPVTIG